MLIFSLLLWLIQLADLTVSDYLVIKLMQYINISDAAGYCCNHPAAFYLWRVVGCQLCFLIVAVMMLLATCCNLASCCWLPSMILPTFWPLLLSGLLVSDCGVMVCELWCQLILLTTPE